MPSFSGFELYFRSFDGCPTPTVAAMIAKHLGLRLPPDLMALWSQTNGCLFPMVNCIAPPPASDGDSFFSTGFVCDSMVAALSKSGESRILDLLNNKVVSFPHGYLPLVDDACGNYVLFKVGVAKLGEVLYWDHETHECFPAFADARSFFASLGPQVEYDANEIEEEKRECFAVDFDLIFSGGNQ